MIGSAFVLGEAAVANRLGIGAREVRRWRGVMTEGKDWEKGDHGRVMWSEGGLESILSALSGGGSLQPVPRKNGAAAETAAGDGWDCEVEVVKCDFKNNRLVLAKDGGGGFVTVEVHPSWRDLFVRGMRFPVRLQADRPGFATTRKPIRRGFFGPWVIRGSGEKSGG